ncbi:MAG: thymidylate kinase [Candidatus Gracilibacteria bacterium]|nr:thymidylate kinase [Candidatus Gracilibacteria bacterium]MDQ7023236.1 thymidylate kinase [Candidatus Gracilibacteria bacterium]
MFIVIDGIDGSGKGTQVALLEKNLLKLGKKVKILDYPRYGEKSAFAVEKYLNGEYGKEVTAKQASIFYAIDRFDDSFEIKKDLENYDYIISNRYVSANMIHQAGKILEEKEREEFLDWLYDLEYNIFKINKPDLTIFLNVSPEMSQKLVLMKEKREYLKGDKKMDIHEEDKEHLINAHTSAMSVVEKFNDWTKIDCEEKGKMKSIEEINKEILEKIT